MKKQNHVYIIFAVFAADANCTTDAYALDAYAAANSFELAEKIAQKDEEDRRILKGWTIQKMYLSTSEEDI